MAAVLESGKDNGMQDVSAIQDSTVIIIILLNDLDYVEVEHSMGGMKPDDSHHTNHTHSHPHSHSHSHHTPTHAHRSTASGGGEQPLIVAIDPREGDSDEESDALAKMTHDEYVRQIYRLCVNL